MASPSATSCNCRSWRASRSATSAGLMSARVSMGTELPCANAQGRKASGLRRVFRQRDGDVEDLVVAVANQVDLDGFVFDLDVLADHFEQLSLQHRQVVGARAATAALMRDDDAEAVLGDVRGGLLGGEEIKQAHDQAPKILLKKPFFSTCVKRIGRSSPSSRETASS